MLRIKVWTLSLECFLAISFSQCSAIQDRGVSGVLTFRPSEFSQIHGQYRRTRFGDGRRVANELLSQVLFTTGAHGAHVF